MTQPQQETRLIHCYDMVSFVAEIEKAVKQGFSLDFKKNEHYPVQIGYQLITTMIKQKHEEVKDVEPSANVIKTPQDAVKSVDDDVGSQEPQKVAAEVPKKAGRPAKGK